MRMLMDKTRLLKNLTVSPDVIVALLQHTETMQIHPLHSLSQDFQNLHDPMGVLETRGSMRKRRPHTQYQPRPLSFVCPVEEKTRDLCSRFPQNFRPLIRIWAMLPEPHKPQPVIERQSHPYGVRRGRQLASMAPN